MKKIHSRKTSEEESTVLQAHKEKGKFEPQLGSSYLLHELNNDKKIKKIHSRKISKDDSTESHTQKEKGTFQPQLEPSFLLHELNKDKKIKRIHSRKISKDAPSESHTQKEKGSVGESNVSLAGVKKRKTFKRLAWEIMMMHSICKFFFSGLQEAVNYEITEAITRSEKERMEALEKEKEHQVINFGLLAKISQDRLSHRAVQITMKRPKWRTQEELKLLRILLEGLPSFRQYSRNMQLMLARVIRFERFGRRRVVLKIGHIGDCFYFIYSGSVAITKDKDGSSAFIDKDPTILRKGDAFGEIALLKDSRRNATVVCMEDTELLAVHKRDFFANKLDLEQAEELKYRYDFFRSLDLFASWSDKIIEALAASCKTKKYPTGKVIIADSSMTNKLVFVSKGRCQLLRPVHLMSCPKYQKWIHQHAKQYADIQRDISKSSLSNSGAKQYHSIRVDGHHLLEPVYHRTALHNLPRRLLSKKAQREKKMDFLFNKKHSDDRLHETERQESGRAPKFRPSMMMSSQFGKVHKGFAVAVYMRIDQLQDGDCLGLHQYLLPHRFQDERQLVLISNGAEIITLKRDKFDEFADDATKKYISRYERTYPSDDKLCDIFLEQNRWRIYKSDLAEMLVKHQIGVTKRDYQIEAHSFIRYCIILNQAGMLDPDIFEIPPDSRHPQIPMFYSASDDKKRAGTPTKTDTRLIHGITIPHTEMELLLR